jgi:hypothetical protein
MRTMTALALALGCTAASAQAADYTLPSILPLTGPAAFVGGGEKEGIEALEEIVNAEKAASPGAPSRSSSTTTSRARKSRSSS